MLDIKKIEAAINQISAEKKIPRESLIEIIEAAIKTAYKKDHGSKDENISVKLDIEGGTIEITSQKTVVQTVTNPALEISFDDLGEDASEFSEGDIIEIDVSEEVMNADTQDSFGRIASQAARQVIIQKIGDSERKKIYELFKDKVGSVLSMRIVMIESGKVVLDYNGNHVMLPKSEQNSRDRYVPETRMYVLVLEASNDDKAGPKVTLSRKNKNIVPAIFALYVPELSDGTIQIESIVRSPGVKTKLLVSTPYDEIDPAGTLIGQKGMRVKSVMDELGGEKIDIISLSENSAEMISRALSPANVLKVSVNEEEKQAIVTVFASERAKAIGKNGININLASQLLGYNISVQIVEDEE